MYASIFTDEVKIDDLAEALDLFHSWGMERVDLRDRVFGGPFHALDDAGFKRLRSMLDARNLKVACLESSLAKVHLPEKERQQQEAQKLEGIIRAADALDCRLVRSFFYWQPNREAVDEKGRLNELPQRMEQTLAMYEPLAARAREAGLTLAFENCGVATWEVKSFIEALGGDNLGLAWDVYNGWFSESELRARDEDAYIRDNAVRTRVVHVKSAYALPETPDAIPYNRILPRLAQHGFDGGVSVETHNSNRQISDVAISKQVLDHVRACLSADNAA